MILKIAAFERQESLISGGHIPAIFSPLLQR